MTNVVELRKLQLSSREDSEFLHSPFYPADVYEGEPVIASLTFIEGACANQSLPFRVWRLSPLGIELLLDPVSHREAEPSLRIGQQIDLKIKLGKQVSEFHGLLVATRHQEKSRALIGIRWCPPREQNTDWKADGSREDRRNSARWLCGEEFLPTGIAPNPTRYNDFIHFRVRDLSKEGLQAITSLRNKHVIPGMVLDSALSLPMVGDLKVKLRIENARIRTVDGRDYLALGMSFHHPDPPVFAAIGQYLFQFGPKASVADLKASGFSVKTVTSALEFGSLRSAEEYEEVLAFRHRAYAAVGKLAVGAGPHSAADIFDTRARILTVRHRAELVASARIMFHFREDQMEHEQFLKLPESFPRKDEILELTRICTHTDYRGQDLFFGLMKHVTLTAAQSGRNWILGSAEPKLVGSYTRLGYQRTGVTYCHSSLGGAEHEILLGNIQQMLSGHGVEMGLWNELYSDLSYYLNEQEMMEFDPLMNLRMRVYRSLGPITQMWTSSIRKPKRKAGSPTLASSTPS